MTANGEAEDERFLAVISHELRGSLHAVLGLSEVLTSARLSPREREIVQAIHREALSMRVLVDDIVSFGELGNGSISMSEHPFSPRAMVVAIADAFRAETHENHVRLLVSSSADVPRLLLGDGVRFGQVVRNLVGNAVRYTDRGSIDVTLDFVDGTLGVAVADTGCGIAADQLDRIFEPFSRVGDTNVFGTGLGLAVARRIVDAMGGTLEVESEVGSGSTFRVGVPLPECEQQLDDVVPGQGAARGHVLVVEDSLVNQTVATAQLGMLGLECTCVESAEVAFEILESYEFDLVLMDWNLPGRSGPEAATIIRDRGLLSPDVPIVAMTANVLSGDREACLAAGMNGYLAKPVSLEDLRGVTDYWLDAGADDRDGPPSTSIDRAIDALTEELGDPEVVASLIKTFLGELPERRAAILRSEPGSVDAAVRAAHTLRSTSALIGAKQLAELCADFESNEVGRGDIRSAIDAEIDRLEAAFRSMIDPNLYTNKEAA